MCNHSCIVLVLLEVAVANATPVWFYNTGFANAFPTGVGCSTFTRKYDPYTGFFTYTCDPDVMNSNHLSSPTFVKTSSDTVEIDDKDSAEDGILTPQESFSVRSGGPHSRVTYQSFTSGRSGGSRKKNNRPNKRPSTNSSRRNRCPPGQNFQSELNICITYPSAPPLPPRRTTNHRLSSSHDRMLGDAPVRPVSAAHQRSPASGTILAVGKFSIQNRCKPTELYISELDICLPKNNCYPYGPIC